MLILDARRDLVENDLFSRDLHAHGLITREEIEELFGRDMDADVTDLFERKQTTLNQFHERHPAGAANFFQSIGDFVKRCARGYWKHMIRKYVLPPCSWLSIPDIKAIEPTSLSERAMARMNWTFFHVKKGSRLKKLPSVRMPPG
jgi:hypothetical protein